MNKTQSSFHQVLDSTGANGNRLGRVGADPGETRRGVLGLITHMDNFIRLRPRLLAGFHDSATLARNRSARARLSDADARTPRGMAIRAAMAQDAQVRLKNAILDLGARLMAHDADPYSHAADSAMAYCDRLARAIATDAAFDPTAGGSQYPAQIAQRFIAELQPLPKTHFAELFPDVSGEQPLMPGMEFYTSVRGTPAGEAKEVSARNPDGLPTVELGEQSDVHNTCWLGIAVVDNIRARIARMVPGAQIFGEAARFQAADLSMLAVQNRIEWFGNGGSMTGLLNEPALKPVAVKSPTDGHLINCSPGGDDADAVVEALIYTFRSLNSRSTIRYTDLYISHNLAYDLTRQLKGADGVTAESIGSYLLEKVLKVAMPSVTRVVTDIWELDKIGSGGRTATEMLNGENGATMTQAQIDAMGNGMLLTSNGPFGIKRVPILDLLTLPVVDGGIIQTFYKLSQFGEPYVSPLGENTLITVLGS